MGPIILPPSKLLYYNGLHFFAFAKHLMVEETET